ncbi:MAG TPA: polymer-forming cytoskeletal protein [Thermoanaerobaculia bacterium]|nr:polymer-forming cytoskeletal protein [Thermoanaerobaculia bacterium]
MSIFRRENASSTPAFAGGASDSSSSPKGRLTHVAPGTRLSGEVTGATELLIDGEVEGEVRVDATVTVGAEGAVHGPISAPVVRVAGTVVGNVTASERVEVGPSGSVEGDITAPRIVISEGAFFKGQMVMRGEKAREARRPRGAGEPETKLVEAGKP